LAVSEVAGVMSNMREEDGGVYETGVRRKKTGTRVEVETEKLHSARWQGQDTGSRAPFSGDA